MADPFQPDGKELFRNNGHMNISCLMADTSSECWMWVHAGSGRDYFSTDGLSPTVPAIEYTDPAAVPRRTTC